MSSSTFRESRPHLSDKDKEREEWRRRDRVIQMTEEEEEEEEKENGSLCCLPTHTPTPPHLSRLHSHSLFLALAFPCNPCHPWKTITSLGGLAKFPIWPISESRPPHHHKLQTGSNPFAPPLSSTYNTRCPNKIKQRGAGGWARGRQSL